MPLCSSHWFSGWGQCCLRVQRFSPLHQTHPKSGSAFRHKPQLPRWASHLYRWTRGKKREDQEMIKVLQMNNGKTRKVNQCVFISVNCVKCKLKCTYGLRRDDHPKHNISHLLSIVLFKCAKTYLSFWVICICVSTTPSQFLYSVEVFLIILFGFCSSCSKNVTYIHGNRPLAILFLIVVRRVHVWPVDQMMIREPNPPHSQQQGDVRANISGWTFSLC